MIYRYIYKITCTEGSFKGKFYIGQHTTKDLNDNYRGSGKLIVDYLKKYPNSYVKEIICFCDTIEELNKAEYEIIHPIKDDPMCLNIIEGGYYNPIGTFTGKHHTEETKKKIGNSNRGKKRSEEFCKHNSDIKKGQIPWNKGTGKPKEKSNKPRIPWNKGLKCCYSKETLEKMSEAKKNYIPWNKKI